MKVDNLKGALARVKRRATPNSEWNEFDYEPAVQFEATRKVVPTPQWDEGTTVILEIALRSHYKTFRGDNDEVHAQVEGNAMRSMCRCLYEDVLDDLLPIMRAVGDGKRHQALHMLNELFVRLNGEDRP